MSVTCPCSVLAVLGFAYGVVSNHNVPEQTRSESLDVDSDRDVQRFLPWGSTQDPSLREILVVPELKFMFCFIPKNACTQFNRMMNELNGFVRQGAVCSEDDPNYISSWGNVLPAKTLQDMKLLFKDPTWTKGVFLRDPLARLVSGYQSECVPPQECGGCMNFETANENAWPNFDEFVSNIEHGRNPHFDPQASLCGGLVESIDDFDFIGEITTNYTQVAEQVRQMMELAFRVGTTMSPPARRISARKLAGKFFATTGPSQNSSHHHPNTDTPAYFRNESTLFAALDNFRTDYKRLPRLKIPDWAAARVHAH